MKGSGNVFRIVLFNFKHAKKEKALWSKGKSDGIQLVFVDGDTSHCS